MMTRRGRMAGAVVVVVGLCGAAVLGQTAVLTTLKANEAEAKNQIFSTFSSGGFYAVGSAAVFKVATAEQRALFVKGVMEFARTYSTTADFAKRYATYRDGQKPSAPEVKTGEQMREEQRKGYQEAIKNAEDMIKQMPAMKKDFDPVLAQYRQQLADIGKNKAQDAETDKMFATLGEAQMAEYKASVAEWEKKYPTDPKAMVASRLREFLEMSSTVAFDAKTELKNKQQVFVDPQLERKDARWKMMYRAGKPAVDAARASAQEWLKVL